MSRSVSCAGTQIWAGSKQKELQANSSQLLQRYSPLASLMLGMLVCGLEPVGFRRAPASVVPYAATIAGFNYTFFNTICILISSVLGLFVSLSTFLAIGATSSLTYNVVSDCLWREQ
jgi:solute carrier family 35, member E3